MDKIKILKKTKINTLKNKKLRFYLMVFLKNSHFNEVEKIKDRIVKSLKM